MYGARVIRGCVIGLVLMELTMAAEPLAPSRVFRLPVWQEASEWARSRQLADWDVRSSGVAEQYLVSRVDDEHWQRLQVECGGDVKCESDSCQQVRTGSRDDDWLVPQAPDLYATLTGQPWACGDMDEKRWQEQRLEQPACWALQRGQGCEVRLTSMAVLQPAQRKGYLLVLLPDGEGMAELSRAIGMEVLSADPLQVLSATLAQFYSAEPGRVVQAQQWLSEHRPDLLHQPDLVFESGLQGAAGGVEQASAQLFDLDAELEISVGLIDTGVSLVGSGGQLIPVDFTGAGYRAAETGTALASVLGRHLRSMRLFSYQACLPVGVGLVAYCSSSAIIRSLDRALVDRNNLIQLGPVGPGGRILHQLVRQAQLRGVVLIAGVGDAGASAPPLYPAAWPEVLAVTAVQGEYKRLAAAGTGKHVDLAAMGGNVLVSGLDRGQRLLSGTSLAAANVTGLVARLLQAPMTVSPLQLYQYLRESSDDVGRVGPDSEFGSGVINPCRAWRLLAPVTEGCRVEGGL